MMKTKLSNITLGSAVLFFLCAFVSLPSIAANAAGKPVIRNYDIPVGQFNTFSVDDNVHVVYRCVPDSAGHVVYRGDDRFDNAFIFTNNNGNLRIQVNTEDVNDPELPVIYLYSDYLTKARNGADFSVTIEEVAPTPKLEITQIGNGTISADNIKATNVIAKLKTGQGNIVLSGKCEKAKLSVVGTGTIQADRLKSDNVSCKIMGGGVIGCWADKELGIKGIGSTKIYYKGKPEIRKKGGGHIISLDTDQPKQIYIPSRQ